MVNRLKNLKNRTKYFPNYDGIVGMQKYAINCSYLYQKDIGLRNPRKNQ